MFVLGNPHTGNIEVYPKPPKSYDPTFDVLTVPDDSVETAQTSQGVMLLTDALMELTGAFRLTGGQLTCDPKWAPDE